MRELVELMMPGEERAGGEGSAPSAPLEGEETEHHDAPGNERRGNAPADLDQRLLRSRRAADDSGKPAGLEKQQGMMEIPVVIEELLHFSRFVRMIVIRELMMPRVERETAREERGAPEREQPAVATHGVTRRVRTRRARRSSGTGSIKSAIGQTAAK